MKNIVIVGHGFPDIFDIITELNKSEKTRVNVLGYLDDNPKFLNKKYWGYKTIGNLNWLKKNKKNTYIINAVGSSPKNREKVFKRIKDNKGKIKSLIHPSVNTKNIKIGNGVIICKGSTLGYGAKIMNGVIMSWNSHVGHNSIIGKNSFLAAGSCVLGNCKISENVFIGANAAVLKNIKIGSNSRVGICTPVIENLKKNSVIFGNPGRIFYKNEK